MSKVKFYQGTTIPESGNQPGELYFSTDGEGIWLSVPNSEDPQSPDLCQIANLSESGNKWFTGTNITHTSGTQGGITSPNPNIVTVGDFFLNTDTGNVYQNTGTTTWKYLFCMKSTSSSSDSKKITFNQTRSWTRTNCNTYCVGYTDSWGTSPVSLALNDIFLLDVTITNESNKKAIWVIQCTQACDANGKPKGKVIATIEQDGTHSVGAKIDFHSTTNRIYDGRIEVGSYTGGDSSSVNSGQKKFTFYSNISAAGSTATGLAPIEAKTVAIGTNDNTVATTAFVQAELKKKIKLILP